MYVIFSKLQIQQTINQGSPTPNRYYESQLQNGSLHMFKENQQRHGQPGQNLLRLLKHNSAIQTLRTRLGANSKL